MHKIQSCLFGNIWYKHSTIWNLNHNSVTAPNLENVTEQY